MNTRANLKMKADVVIIAVWLTVLQTEMEKEHN